MCYAFLANIDKSIMKKILKNIESNKVLTLAGMVSVQQGQIVSKTLVQNKNVSITLFSFDKGEEIGTHDSSGDAMVSVLEGEGRFKVGDTEHIVKAGETLVMPAGVPHSVFAKTPFKWILVVVFPDS